MCFGILSNSYIVQLLLMQLQLRQPLLLLFPAVQLSGSQPSAKTVVDLTSQTSESQICYMLTVLRLTWVTLFSHAPVYWAVNPITN